MRYLRTIPVYPIALVCLLGCRQIQCDTDKDCPNGTLCIAAHCLPMASDTTKKDADVTEIRNDPPPKCPAPVAGRLVLNEILADPNSTDMNGDDSTDPYDDEFVEIMNVDEHSVNIGGVALLVGSKIKHVFAPVCLPPRHALVVFGGGTIGPTWDHGLATVSLKRLGLANTGSRVRLLSAEGTILDSHQYTASLSETRSVTREPDGLGSWAPHPTPLGYSPGFCVNGSSFPKCEQHPITEHDDQLLDSLHDCALVAPGELRLNEIMPDPGLVDTNQDGLLHSTTDEFVEVILLSDGERRVGRAAIFVNGEERVKLPDVCLKPSTVILVFGGGTPKLKLEPPSLIVSSPKALRLPNTGGQLSIHLDGTKDSDVVWGSEADRNQSISLHPDLTGKWTLHQSISNEPASPGRCSNGSNFTAQGCITAK